MILKREKKSKIQFSLFSKIRFRPKMNAEKELRSENGAFDTETTRFPTLREVRSARKRPKIGKCWKNCRCVVCIDTKRWNFGWSKNLSKLRLQSSVRDGIGTVWKVTTKRRVWDRRNWPATAKKLKITTTTDFFPTFFPKKILLIILP